ncbi:UNVERIFIED_ORG: MBL fold metallo-hydrolase (plasmid) [Roseateles sp. XES5]|nr:MBL fold metallo-hydrolase [Roseateles sp. XES5]
MKTTIAWIGALMLSAAIPAFAQDPAIKVTLVGTGGPEYFPDRAGISTLVEANGEKLLFDTGRGVSQRLYETRFNPKDVSHIFLSHLHNDHYEGLPELWMTPWFLLGRDHGFELYGPEGSKEMVDGMRQMFAHDLEKRVNKFNPVENLAIDVDVLKDGVVFEENGVTVTAFPVEHSDGNPAYGFRVDYDGHSVVLSGDTTYSENIVKHGTGADVIVHNVIAFSDRLSALPEMQGVLAKLTTPEQAAKVFSETRPKMAVFSHIVTKELDAKAVPEVIVSRTRAAGYDGPLTMGKDRMVISIGDTVEIAEPQSLDDLPTLDTKGQAFP